MDDDLSSTFHVEEDDFSAEEVLILEPWCSGRGVAVLRGEEGRRDQKPEPGLSRRQCPLEERRQQYELHEHDAVLRRSGRPESDAGNYCDCVIKPIPSGFECKAHRMPHGELQEEQHKAKFNSRCRIQRGGWFDEAPGEEKTALQRC